MHRFNQRHKGATAFPPHSGLKRRAAVTRARQEQCYHCILMRSTKAHLHSVTSVISIQMEEENHICDANSAGALVCRYNVSFGIPHTRLIRTGSFADSNLALCDPQIRGREEELCALECVCLAVGDLHFSISGGTRRDSKNDGGGDSGPGLK